MDDPEKLQREFKQQPLLENGSSDTSDGDPTSQLVMTANFVLVVLELAS